MENKTIYFDNFLRYHVDYFNKNNSEKQDNVNLRIKKKRAVRNINCSISQNVNLLYYSLNKNIQILETNLYTR